MSVLIKFNIQRIKNTWKNFSFNSINFWQPIIKIDQKSSIKLPFFLKIFWCFSHCFFFSLFFLKKTQLRWWYTTMANIISTIQFSNTKNWWWLYRSDRIDYISIGNVTHTNNFLTISTHSIIIFYKFFSPFILLPKNPIWICKFLFAYYFHTFWIHSFFRFFSFIHFLLSQLHRIIIWYHHHCFWVVTDERKKERISLTIQCNNSVFFVIHYYQKKYNDIIIRLGWFSWFFVLFCNHIYRISCVLIIIWNEIIIFFCLNDELKMIFIFNK